MVTSTLPRLGVANVTNDQFVCALGLSEDGRFLAKRDALLKKLFIMETSDIRSEPTALAYNESGAHWYPAHVSFLGEDLIATAEMSWEMKIWNWRSKELLHKFRPTDVTGTPRAICLFEAFIVVATDNGDMFVIAFDGSQTHLKSYFQDKGTCEIRRITGGVMIVTPKQMRPLYFS
jgi:hypothetical protein